MPNNKISPAFLSTTHEVIRREAAPRVSLAARLTARLRAGHFDRQLAVGVAGTRRKRARRAPDSIDVGAGT